MGREFSCEFCTYRWVSRVDRPVSCPRCKRRFDYREARIVLKQLGEKFEFNLGGAQ